MNYKIISIMLALLLVLSAVSALSITGLGYASINQCDSIKQKFTLCSNVLGEYKISVNGAQNNWINIAPSVIVLDSNNCKDFYVFVTPECYANSGSYDFNFLVTGPESSLYNYKVLVNQAHTFSYNVTPLYSSSNPCVASDYNITIRNTSKFVDEFVLVQTGLVDSWVNYPQTKFVINPYTSYSATLRVTTPCNADANTYSFDLGLFNTRTNASSKIALTKVVTKFNPFIIENLVESNKSILNSCEEFDKNVLFNLTNASDKNDELTFEILDENYALVGRDVAYFEQSKVKLDFNSTSVVSLIIKKRTVSDTNLIIKVNSKAYSKNYFYPIELIIKNCYDLNIAQDYSLGSNTNNKTCASTADAVINFSNSGSEKLDFNANVYLNGVLVESKPIIVDANTSIREVFRITAPMVPSTPKVSVKVTAPFIEETLEYNFSFENCFDAGLDVSRILVCKDGYLTQKFLVKNEGSMTSQFNASIDSNWISLSSNVFDLNSGDTKEITLYGNVPQFYSEEQTILVESSSVNISKTVPVITLTNEECNDLNFDIVKVVDANCCEGKIVPLVIRNNGYFAQIIGISSVRPDWMTVSDSNMFLLPKEEGVTYINISPNAGNGGDFNAQLNLITDQNIKREVKFLVHVFGENCVIPDGFDTDTNSKVTDLNGLKVTEVKFDFVILNDSNSDFSVSNIIVSDLNAVVKFDSNKLLKPTESMTAEIVAWFTGSAPMDKNVSVIIETSNGTVTKTQLISFEGKDQSFSITGWFGAYSAPLLGLLFFAIFVIIVVMVFGSSKKKKKGFKW